MNTRKEEREEFCGLCAVAPIAFAGAGAAAAGANMSQKHKKWKQTLLATGIFTVVTSLLVLFYYYFIKKDCRQCKL